MMVIPFQTSIIPCHWPLISGYLDFGHSLMCGENPSQALALLAASGKLFHIHANDNYADWDWDMAAGTVHWWELVEFCGWLERVRYDGYVALDIFPYRLDEVRACELSVKAIEKARRMAGKLKEKIGDEWFRGDMAEIYSLLWDMRP